MAVLSKFTFANDFAVKEDPDKKPAFDKITVLAREEAAYAKGKAEGLEEGFTKGQATMRDEMLSSFEKQLADTLSQLVSSADMCLQELESEVSKHHDAFMSLSYALAQKLAGEALEKFGFANVESLIKSTLRELSSAPHIVLRVTSDTAVELEKRLSGLKAETGFSGQIIILPEEGLSKADCRIEWADGAIVRSQKEISDSINSVLGVSEVAEADPSETETDQDTVVPEGDL